MTPVPFSDGVIQLTLASEAERGRTLLRAATELFVFEPRHSRTEIAVFEELALQLMRITPLDDRVAIARMLATHTDTPAAVLSMLIADGPAVAAPVIADCADLPEVMQLALVASGSDEHLALLARRPRLAAAVVEALVRRLPVEHLPALLANPTVRLPEAVVGDLLRLARSHPDLAAALARRHDDVEDADLTDLFLDLDDRGRRRVLQSLEILALRDFAARRPAPRPTRPDESLVADLSRAALSRDVPRMAALLGTVCGLDTALARRLIGDKGGEPLAIALKAAGVDAATATRVILFSGVDDVRDYFAVKRLVDLFEGLSLRSATLLVRRWGGDVAPLPGRVHRHLPQTEAGTPVRGRDDAAPRPAPLPMPRRERS